ncbi:MAG: right-handed parallel beta-helix repeat-containing protein [Saprospiraceae bacterium]|nr:right-handed parallel beta-helix repeat-containing protein [Saprospiraceae bacterium]
MKSFILPFLLLFTLILAGCKKDKNEITVPAGSVDALAQAVEDAGDGGTVILASGNHNESGSVTVSTKVCIRGETGAILIVDTKPLLSSSEPLIDPALFVLNAEGFCIENVEIQPLDSLGCVGIFLENSSKSVVTNCKFTRHQNTILFQNSDEVKIENNSIEGILDIAGSFPVGNGLIVINGKKAIVRNNEFSKCAFGAWICDEGGTFEDNHCFRNHIGVVPCAVPDGGAISRESGFLSTMIAGKDWKISNNKFYHNDWFGVLLYDGASLCTVENNDCSDNGLGDIELGKDSNTFGFHADVTHHNTVIVGSFPNVRVKDCGENNTVDISKGGILLPSEDCF